MKHFYDLEDLNSMYSAINAIESGNLNDYEKEVLNNSVDEYRRTHPEEF